MSYAVFKITDGTVSGTVDFLSPPFYLVNWSPVIPGFKNGGEFVDPPIADGRRLVFFTYENATERIDFKMKSDSPDASNAQLSKLAKLMDKAARHWTTNGEVGPVWLEAKSQRETSVKYTKLIFGRLSGMSNPFVQPYLQADCASVIENDLVLLTERDKWQTAAPGTSSTLPMTGNEYTSNALFMGNFESDYIVWRQDDSDIELSITSQYSYEGERSGRIEGVSGGGVIYQDIYVPGKGSGDTVTCTVWAKVDSGTAELNVYDGGGLTNAVSDTSTSSSWTQLSVTKTVPASEYIRFAIGVSAITDVAYFDVAEVSFSYGKSATQTTNPVYFSNSKYQGPISHIFVDDGTVFGNNLVTQTLPYNLLPASPQVGDAVYFGSCVQTVQHGHAVFSNIVLNLTSAANVTLDWEYYDDDTSSWEALGVQDNTEDLSVTGEETLVSISLPSTWVSTTVNGVYGAWIRAVVATVGGTGAPTQASFHPFSIADNYVEIQGTQLVGDESPLIDLNITNVGGTSGIDEQYFLSAGSNDGVWDDATGGPTYGDTSQSLETLGQNESMLVRFTSLNIPQGATILSAKIGTNPGPSPDMTDGGGYATFGITLEDIADSPALNTGESTSARTWQSYFTEWTLSHFTAGGTWRWIFTPDLSDHFQDIVDKSTWVSGNDVTVRITDLVVGATDYAQFYMYEDSPASPRLDISWIAPETYTSGMVIGSRKTSRGSGFQSILSTSPVQKNGISVSIEKGTALNAEPGIDGPLHDLRMPTITWVSSGSFGIFSNRVIWRIPPDISDSFTGRFRTFVRAYVPSTTAEVDAPVFRLKYGVAGSTAYSQVSGITTFATPELIDLGSISIPEVGVGEQAPEIELALQATRNNGLEFYIIDLVLIPADEWIAEITAPQTVSGSLKLGTTVSAKSINTTNILKTSMPTDRGKIVPWFSSGRTFAAEPEETIRLWFIATTNEAVTGRSSATRASHTNMTYKVTANILNRFNIYPG